MKRHIEQLCAALLLIVVLLGISFYQAPHTADTATETGSLGTLRPIPNKDAYAVPQFNPGLIISTSTLESVFPTFHATTTVIKKKKFPVITVTPPQKPLSPAPHPSSSASTTPVLPNKPITPPQTTTTVDTSLPAPLKKTLVNILCTSHKAPLRGTSGSGVLIDSEGIILTVAHVAQAELLSETVGEGVISCVVRTGDPARNAYKARVIYISEPWLRKNSTTLISSQPMGTGENDFALLAIVGSANGSPVPSSFPSVSFSGADSAVGDEVGVGGYAAQYLTSAQVRTALSPTFVTGSISNIYTFRTTSQDVLAILAGKAAQEGSSGGGAVNKEGRLIGLITTSEISGDFTQRHLRVITPTHIRSSFESDMGQTMSSYLGSASASVLVANYASKVSVLGDFLASAIGMK
jgi:hypothetical protein